MQNSLNKFFKELDNLSELPTNSAYCQARQKFKPELFIYLNHMVLELFYDLYEKDKELKSFFGKRLLAIDCSRFNIPDTPQTREKYTVQTNQHPEQERVQASGSFLYDVLNDVVINCALDKIKAEKKFIFDEHISYMTSNDIAILDRAYADYCVMSTHIHNNIDFVIRFPRASFKKVNRFWASSQTDQIVELEVPRARKKFVKKNKLPKKIKVRLIKIELPTGEIEVLGTSLLDKKKYPASMFEWLYWQRWGVETFFDRLKNIFEIERFSGTKLISIEQDFYGMVLLANLESILSRDSEQELIEKSKNNQYEQRVNHSVSYSAMIDYTIELFLDESKDIDKVLQELDILFKTNPVLKRNGRQFPRKILSPSQRLYYQKYTKRIPP